MKTASLNDGTLGKRYPWGLVRTRTTKRRYGVTNGPVMLGIHTGYKSVYIQRPFLGKRRLHSFAG